MDLINFIPDGFKRAVTIKITRWAGGLAGGAVFGYLMAHSDILSWVNQACASLSSEDAMKGFVGAGAVALLALFSSIKDAQNVTGKMASAAAAGYDKGQAQAVRQAAQQGAEAQASADTAKIAAVADAMKQADQASKQDKAGLVAALKTGAF